MEAQWQEEAKAEEKKQRATLAATPETDLRLLLRVEDVIEQREQNAERQAARFRGPSPGL